MSSGNEPKPFRGNVLYSRKLEATEPLYGDLNRIGTVQVKSAAPARSRRNARSRTEAFSSWYGVNTQMPAEMTALATRAAIPTQLAAGARGRGAIVHARDLRMASSDLRSVASSNYWRQGVGVIGRGLAVAAKVSGALASRGSGSGRPNATKSFERPIGPRLQQSRREGPGAGRTALLTAAARRPTRAGPFAPRGTAVGNVQGADVEWSTAWSERTKSVGSASRSGLSSNSLSSGPGALPIIVPDPRRKASPDPDSKADSDPRSNRDPDRLLDLLAERASRPPRGVTGVDPRLGPTYPGGFGRQW